MFKARFIPSASMFACLAALLPGMALAEDCPAERGLYTHNAEAGVTARFIPAAHFASMASNLYFEIETAQRRYWFTMQASNGYGGLWLTPVGDPYQPADGDPDNGPVEIATGEDRSPLGIYPLDADNQVSIDAPNKGQAAPAYIFVPELGPTLWYGVSTLTTDAQAQQDTVSQGMFALTGCADTAPEPATP